MTKDEFLKMMADIWDGAEYEDKDYYPTTLSKVDDGLYLSFSGRNFLFKLPEAKLKKPAPPPPRPTWEDVKGAKKIIFNHPDATEENYFTKDAGWTAGEVNLIKQMLADPEFTVEVIE